MKKIAIFSTLVAAFFVAGCATTSQTSNTIPSDTASNVAASVENALPYIKAGATVACAVAIQQVAPTNRVEIIHQINAVSVAVAALSSGNVPTPDQLSTVLKQFSVNDSQWTILASALQDIYNQNFNKLNGNVKVAVDVLNAIASGCQQATQNYVNSLPAQSATTNSVN